MEKVKNAVKSISEKVEHSNSNSSNASIPQINSSVSFQQDKSFKSDKVFGPQPEASFLVIGQEKLGYDKIIVTQGTDGIKRTGEANKLIDYILRSSKGAEKQQLMEEMLFNARQEVHNLY